MNKTKRNMVATITTVIYALITLYVCYMAIMHLYVYFANIGLGHRESPTILIRYVIGALVGLSLCFLGYKYYKSGELFIVLKILFFTPITLAILYILWGILMVISAGGKWN